MHRLQNTRCIELEKIRYINSNFVLFEPFTLSELLELKAEWETKWQEYHKKLQSIFIRYNNKSRNNTRKPDFKEAILIKNCLSTINNEMFFVFGELVNLTVFEHHNKAVSLPEEYEESMKIILHNFKMIEMLFKRLDTDNLVNCQGGLVYVY